MHTEGLPIKLLKGQIVNLMLLLLWKSGAIQRKRRRRGRWCVREETWAKAAGLETSAFHILLFWPETWHISHYAFLSRPVEKIFWTYTNEHRLCTNTHRSKGPNNPSCLVELNFSPPKSPAPPRVGTGSAEAKWSLRICITWEVKVCETAQKCRILLFIKALFVIRHLYPSFFFV